MLHFIPSLIKELVLGEKNKLKNKTKMQSSLPRLVLVLCVARFSFVNRLPFTA